MPRISQFFGIIISMYFRNGTALMGFIHVEKS